MSNFGSVALTGITLTDPSVSDLAPVTSGGFNVGDTNHNNQLDTTESWSYTAHHTVTQAEIDSNGGGDGTIDNTATADSDQTGPVSASVVVAVQPAPHLTVTKTAVIPDSDHDGKIDSPADDISYTITVLNDGNETQHGVVVNDTLLGSLTTHTETGGTGTNGDDILDVGETWTYTAGYDVTQADIDNRGSVDGTADDNIHNQVTVETDQVFEASAAADVAIDYRPHLTLHKTAVIPDSDTAGDPTLNDGKIDSPADDISYAFTIVNDGNVTLHGVLLNDTLLGAQTTHTETGGTGTNGDDILDVGETWSYTAAYDVQQADIDNHGSADGTADDNIHNDASVTTNESASGSDSADVAIDYRPSVTLVKAGMFDDEDNDGFADVGEHINYTFTITNNGNVTLHNVGVNDAEEVSVNGTPIASLAPGATDGTSWTASHAITQSDIDNGYYNNTAVVGADEASASSGTEHVVLPPPQPPASPAMTLDMSDAVGTVLVDSSEDGIIGNSGDLIEFVFQLTNVSNLALSNVVLNDPLLGVTLTGPDSPDANGLLDVGETWIYSHNYFLTAADVTAGHVDNNATVTAMDPLSNVVSATAHWDVLFPV